MASSINNSEWLDWMAGLMGGASRQTYSATFPPNRYYCLLDELPVHLIPRPAFAAQPQEAGRSLFLNPQCKVYVAGELPQELSYPKELQSAFALQGAIAWLHDEQVGSWVPFWLGPELEAIVTGLRSDEPVSDTIPGKKQKGKRRFAERPVCSKAEDTRRFMV